MAAAFACWPHAQPWERAVPKAEMSVLDAGSDHAVDPSMVVTSTTAALPASISRTSHQQQQTTKRRYHEPLCRRLDPNKVSLGESHGCMMER